MTELDALSCDSIGSGIGYNICLMNLDSPDEDLRGSLQLRHHGPVVFACLRLWQTMR